MTEAALRTALADSMVETLDAMFFTACLDQPAGESAPGQELAAQVDFDGGPPGRLTLRIAVPAARSIAAGFLGEEEDAITERQVADVVGEMANMICGSVLSRVEGAGEFRLAAPRIMEPSGFRRPPGAIAHTVETGAGALEAALEM